ncbi:MAG: 4,5-dihydroxyphthalate decarboxylase [Alphaproteobacteria bacterium]|nr:4,5-dihydroxyphthalate decarboxylase [Alphaproteobacteria bacterium]
METLRLTVALSEYDHIRDLTSGVVRPQGLTLVPLSVRPHEMFYRFMTHGEFEVSEMSMGGYCATVADGTSNCIAIPVFPSRVFRHSSVYIRSGGVKKPEDLKGKRIGVAEWGMTAVVYSRGFLTHQFGVPLKDVRWVQGGVNDAGRPEKIAPRLPKGVKLDIVADRSLSEMLIDGDIDAIMCASPPAPLLAGDRRIQPLFKDPRTVEKAYFRETGVYPIMHTVVIRRDVYERDPWVALSLYRAFHESKERSVRRIMHPGSAVPIPWSYMMAQEARKEIFGGGEYWPYGVEPNRPTLEAFLRYCHEQGVTRRKLKPEDLFAKEVLDLAKE